jgi:ABC-2 type transport system ATP-binding protein
MTVLYTTHYMEEAQELSDHIGIMDHGELISCGTHAELVRIVGEMDRIRLGIGALVGPEKSALVLGALQELEGVQDPVLEDGVISLLAQDGGQALPAIFEAAAKAGVRVASVEIREPNLESVFLHLTGRALRD